MWNSSATNVSHANVSGPPVPYLSADYANAWSITYLFCCFTGTVLNIAIITMIFYLSNFRTSCGLLIAHSLIAHTALIAISFPITGFTVYGNMVGHWRSLGSYCGFILWMQMTFRYAANWLDALVALNRFTALLLPYYYRRFSKKKTEAIEIALIWAFGAGLAVPGWFNLGIMYAYQPGVSCTVVPRGSWGVFTFVLGYYLSLTISGLCYATISLKVLFGRCRPGVASAGQQPATVRRRFVMAKMLGVSFLWNTICYLMVPVLLSVAPAVYQKAPQIVLWFGTVQVFGYATDPVIFCAMNSDYRAGLLSLVTRRSASGIQPSGAAKTDKHSVSVQNQHGSSLRSKRLPSSGGS